jgi:hypothetical protein
MVTWESLVGGTDCMGPLFTGAAAIASTELLAEVSPKAKAVSARKTIAKQDWKTDFIVKLRGNELLLLGFN